MRKRSRDSVQLAINARARCGVSAFEGAGWVFLLDDREGRKMLSCSVIN